MGAKKYTLPFNSPQLLSTFFNEHIAGKSGRLKIQSTDCKYNRFVSICVNIIDFWKFSKFETLSHCYQLYQQLSKYPFLWNILLTCRKIKIEEKSLLFNLVIESTVILLVRWTMIVSTYIPLLPCWQRLVLHGKCKRENIMRHTSRGS